MCASVMTVQSLVAAINLAIPKPSASSLHPSPTGLLWIVDSYVIVFAALLVPAGALGDRLGRKGALLSGLAWFAAGGTESALAPDVAVLLTGRALAGAGAALLMPASMSLLLHGVPAGRRAAAVAVRGASQPVGGVLGDTGGALILQYLPWRALFSQHHHRAEHVALVHPPRHHRIPSRHVKPTQPSYGRRLRRVYPGF